jgi:hypothetical protein
MLHVAGEDCRSAIHLPARLPVPGECKQIAADGWAAPGRPKKKADQPTLFYHHSGAE